MSIPLEKIDELRKRTNCSYEEAKTLLEKYNGDLVEAIVEFERNNSPKSKNKYCDNAASFGTKVKRLIKKGFKTKFIIEKSGETIINVPVNILIIALLIFHWFLVIALVISFVLGCRFKIRKENGENIDVNKVVNGFGSKVREATGCDTNQQNSQNNQNQPTNSIVKKDNDDDSNKGYNEMTIE